ncbi:ninein-like protein isoform X3 [Xyrichtys novacula]|uniref:Ninein-like protein isoform X3 n=1 Tax=Xyrichtys novacula TaxID=13765 RepID=A0AAV1G1U5_XYRNO|nr:ninein-like protein isoform X3 [Xyrichtys novacula]
MEEAEHSRYVTQLKAEFDSCDTTATGFLDRDELTVLCRKLQLDAHLPLLLDTLLGARTYGRVNFEEFKEGFVAVLSRSLDFSTSEDDSSYMDPVVPEEVKPKFIKGTKRYGRRSRPDSKPDSTLTCDSEDSPQSRNEATDSSPAGVRRAKLRRSTSLESMESLKSDEESGSQKENIQPDFQNKGVQDRVAELSVVGGGVCAGDIPSAVCGHGLTQINAEELDLLLRKLDPDLDGRISIRDFQKVLHGSTPISCSTPVRSADLQRAPKQSEAVSEERSARFTTPSLLTATVGQRVLSRLDDGSGCSTSDRVIALWTEEGIKNSQDILQTLDFPLEERLSLADLTLALDNELLVSGNGIHQAALISYKNEIQHLLVLAEQACRERDKVKADLELADHRNLQLVREVDDRHTSMETLNQTRIRDLEQDFRDRLAVLRTQSEQESEVLLQQVERERSTLQDELQLFKAQEARLQEELCSAAQENSQLEEELSAVKLKLTEAESSVNRLQKDLDQLLHDKFGSLDPSGSGLSHEERFSEIIREYELQCRELRDRNDELSSELELLKSQRSDRKSRQRDDDNSALSWTQQQQPDEAERAESDSDESDMKRSSSPQVRKKLKPADRTALGSLDVVSGPAVSIQTELALEQLKQKHSQELQQLHIQLETQVNFYERSLEMMRQSMEVERKDISQAFKMEISELEEQKVQVEQQVKQLKETVDKMQTQIQHGGGGGWSSEQDRRMQRERAELEQNYAREIGNLVQRLSSEKDQLEAELKLKMDQEVMRVRGQLEEVRLENGVLQERLSVLQQEVQSLEDDVSKKRRRLEEMEKEHERSREEQERLHKENSRYREEVLDLSSRNLQLSNDNAELSARLCGDQKSVQMLQERLVTVSKEEEEKAATVRRLQDAAGQQERERMQEQVVWTQERQQMERDLQSYREKLGRLSEVEAELSNMTLKRQWLEDDKNRLQREADERNNKVEKLQQSLLSVESEAERLRSQLHAVSQEKLGHAQGVSDLQKKLQDAQRKMEELESSVRRLMKEKEELSQDLEEQKEQTSISLREETHKLRVQNQELQQKLSELQVQGLDVHKLTQEQQNLKTKLNQLETARTQAEDQVLRADTALSLAQAQHLRQIQELQEQVGAGCREQAELLQARLQEEQRRNQQLEETLRLQSQQSSSQIIMKQDQYEKTVSTLQQRMEELETKLKGVRLVLQEKVQQLKDQMAKNTKSSMLLKNLYMENSELMKALQVTEKRQKSAEKRNSLLEEKVRALNKLLREIVPASLAT